MSQKENKTRGVLYVVGIGPGAKDHCTPAALAAIGDAEIVVGYSTYIGLVLDLVEGKEVHKSGMTEEIGRARAAVERARDGAKVALISSGDAGVYGMAGLVFEVLRTIGWKRGESPELRIVPGVSAINSCASLLGAPLIHDFCAISLSDLLTPWPIIARRIEAAAQADFVIGLYNPASGRRTRQIVEAHEII
jgi:precorrin-3B C17-methyltransferase